MQERKMEEFISSDFTNPEMIADQTFSNILDVIQKSNLNFQLQVSPFSAFISLKKSLVKNRSGSILLPPPSLATAQTSLPSSNFNLDDAKHDVKIYKLENDLIIQKNVTDDAVNKYENALEQLKLCEEKCKNLEKESKAFKQENKSLATKLENKTIEISQLKASELSKDKNIHSVALKSVKQDLKAQIKASEGKLAAYEKKLSELNEFKAKKMNEERQERLRKKKELKREAKKRVDSSNNPNRDTFDAKEEHSGKKAVEKVDESDISVVKSENEHCLPAPALTQNTDSSFAPSQPSVRDPDLNPPLSDETLEVKARDIELEARMDENAPVTMKSLTEYFDTKFDNFQIQHFMTSGASASGPARIPWPPPPGDGHGDGQHD